MPQTITLAHSPDVDDAFMFYALRHGKVDSLGLEFKDEHHDIESLNRRARDGDFDVTAISIAAYPAVRKKYMLLSCGASVGDGYGPIVVAKRPLTRSDLDEATVAVPGEMTTACLALRLFSPTVRYREEQFDLIPDKVAAGDVDAGLLIHEGQLTYSDHKLTRIVDLGEWWKLGTGLPLALGANAVRRELGVDTANRIAAVLRSSIRYAMDHEEEALGYAMEFGRGLDKERAARFARMYVNDLTVDLGARGKDAVATVLRYGHDAGLFPELVTPEFVG